MPCDPEEFCRDGVAGAQMLAGDALEGFQGMEQQSKFYLLWSGVILLTLAFLLDLGTLLLLGLGLCIGGAAQLMLARRFPALYATDEKAWHRTDETQAINPSAAAAGRGTSAEAEVAAQLRAIETLGATGVLTAEQVRLGKQQVLAASSDADGGADGGGGGAWARPAPLPRSSSMQERISTGQSPRVDTTDVGIEPMTMTAASGGGRGGGAAGHQSWHAQGMA